MWFIDIQIVCDETAHKKKFSEPWVKVSVLDGNPSIFIPDLQGSAAMLGVVTLWLLFKPQSNIFWVPREQRSLWVRYVEAFILIGI